MLLKDRVAVITGGGSGIGKSIALLAAEQGAEVVVNDFGTLTASGVGSSNSASDSVVREIRAKGGAAVASYDSVTTMDGAKNIVDKAISNFGRLDILVTCAGIMRPKWIYNMTEEDWDSVVDVHLKGHFTCTRYACAVMKEQKYGRIIHVSSEAGLGSPCVSNYGAAKEGIVGFTRCVALDMLPYGVTCNAIRPTAGTRMFSPTDSQKRTEVLTKLGIESLLRDNLMKESLNPLPEQVAPLVIFLSMEQTNNVTGCEFVVYDGIIQLLAPPRPTHTICKEGSWTVEEIKRLWPVSLGIPAAQRWK